MRKTITCVVLAVLCITNVMAQKPTVDYYTRNTIVNATTETFKIEKRDCDSFIAYSVYNAKNTHDLNRVFKRTDGTIYHPGADLPIDLFNKAFDKTFTKVRAKTLFLFTDFQAPMFINYIVDAVTGKTLEIYFSLYYYSGLETNPIFSITPQELEYFEKNLKEFVVWDIHRSFEDAPYCIMSHSVGIKK